MQSDPSKANVGELPKPNIYQPPTQSFMPKMNQDMGYFQQKKPSGPEDFVLPGISPILPRIGTGVPEHMRYPSFSQQMRTFDQPPLDPYGQNLNYPGWNQNPQYPQQPRTQPLQLNPIRVPEHGGNYPQFPQQFEAQQSFNPYQPGPWGDFGQTKGYQHGQFGNYPQEMNWQQRDIQSRPYGKKTVDDLWTN